VNSAGDFLDGADGCAVFEEQCDWGKRDAAEVHEHNDSDSGIVLPGWIAG
jgi:hypothetical protein